MNPLDLPGPQFLVFYAVLVATFLILAVALRWFLRFPGGEPSTAALDLTAHEVAYLTGGERRVAEATVAQMVREGTLAAKASDRKLTVSDVPLGAGASELEKAVQAAIRRDNGATIDTLRQPVAAILQPVRQRLIELGLFVESDQGRVAQIIPALMALCAPIVGVIKIGIGISRDKPVMFLVVFCVITAVAAVGIFAKPVLRSRRGDRALAQLIRDNAAMKYQAGERIESLASSDLMLALGLFGMGILAGGPLGRLEAALRPKTKRTGSDWDWGGGWWGSGCGTSCGSSCGGGSCGGGCGGGGCGGCGSG